MAVVDTLDCLEALKESSKHVIRFLETSTGMLRIAQHEGQFHTGDDPIIADKDTHLQFEERLRKSQFWPDLNIWGVVGEERIVQQPKYFTPGARVIVVDPLDGSTAWAMARQAYCVAALSLLAGRDRRLALECAVISTPVHTFTYSAESAEFCYGPTSASKGDAEAEIYDYLIQSTVPETDVRPRSLAFNGYKKQDRKFALELMRELSDWDILTMGGNPFTPYVALGNLTAVMNTRAQCTWDALGTLMCTATDAVVGTIDGTVVDGGAFNTLFNKVALEGNVKLIPPMIVAKNMDAFNIVSDAAGKAFSIAGAPMFDGL
ncbi:MAG: inositol monophosphatase family protein [Propioniciclava sp.]|uniref:hypothetical protein n=1 Tax=Propioniciclava sp. TaxID=2038686 RepID=UPI0039E44FF7